MSWYIRFMLALACMAGVKSMALAQMPGQGAGQLLPVAFSDAWYRPESSPALKAGVEAPFFSIAHTALYGIPGLSLNSLAAACPFKPGTFNLSCFSSGYSFYREWQAGIGYSRGFGKVIKAGIQLDYLSSACREQEGELQAVSFDGGLVAEPLRNLYLAFHLFNPLQIHYARGRYQQIPSLIRFAAGYRPGKKVLLITELEKDAAQAPVWKAAMDYEPARLLVLRYGLHSVQGQYFGLLIRHRKAQIEAGIQRHPTLGCSVSGGFCWMFMERRAP